MELTPSLSPLGVKRFVDLVEAKFFDDQILYRVIPGFLVQFGVAGDPKVHREWDGQRIADEPKLVPFEHGTVSFAGAGPNSRSCHVFIAFDPHGRTLGRAAHETPLGKVTTGLHVLDVIQRNFEQSGYQDLTSLQGEIAHHGNAAATTYSKLDRIKQCRIAKEERKEL